MNKELLSDLKRISNRGIKFCMLKNYLKEKEYKDLDVLFSSEDKPKLKKILKSLGYKTKQMYSTEAFYSRNTKDGVVLLHAQFDYFFNFLKIEDAYGSSQKEKGILW